MRTVFAELESERVREGECVPSVLSCLSLHIKADVCQQGSFA